jgi:RHS repeat-associated protein
VNSQKSYDGTYGLVATETDPRGKVTTYSYDAKHLYPATTTNPLTQATQYLYDYSSGQVKQKTDPNGRVFATVYDGLDRVTAEQQPDLASPSTLVTKTAYVYTDTSGAVSVKKSDNLDASTAADTYSYFDGLGRLVQERKEAEGTDFAARDLVYDSRGLLQKESLPYFSSGAAKTTATTTSSLYSTYAYDPMSRVASVTDSLGTTTNAYADRMLTITDANGKAKDFTRDAYGRLVEVREHNGASVYTTAYAYDYIGDLTKITDALGNVRNFTYDGLGRRLSAEDLHATADTTFGSWSYGFDDAGNLTSRTDAKSQVVNFTYDDLNRVTSEDFTGASGTEVTYGYDSGTDGIGRLTSVANGAVSETLAYNALGLVSNETSTIDSTGYTTTYTYDRQGNRTIVTNPDSSQVKQVFNGAGLLESIDRKESSDSGFTAVIDDFDYAPTGQVSFIDYANGTTTTNTYDATKRYRLASKVTSDGTNNLQNLTYTYDALGNVTRIVDASATSSAKTVDYGYDDLSRLTSATATNVASGQSTYSQTFAYDAIGNLTSGPAGTYLYAGNQGSSYANPHAATSVGGTTLTYDENGNLLTKGSWLTNTWDYQNRLTQSIAGSVTSTYAYDPSGTRVRSADGTTTTRYPTDLYNTDGTTPTKHIAAGGNTVATITGSNASAVARYVHTDHLTGASVVTSSSAAQDELLDYYPYGGVRIDQKAGSFSEQRKYAGHELDAATGLSYMGARYYDSSAARFLSQDPLFQAIGNAGEVKLISKLDQEAVLSDPQLLNSYSYSRNNPMLYRDADGRFIVPALLGASAISGLVGVQLSLAGVTANVIGDSALAARFNNAAMASYAGAAGLAGATMAGPAVSAAMSNPLVAQAVRGATINVAFGLAGQGVSDVLGNASGLQSGPSGVSDYGAAAAKGAFAGAISAGSPWGAASAAFGVSLATDKVMGRPVSIAGAAMDAVASGIATGLVGVARGVSGRLPNAGSINFFIGSHARQLMQASAVEAGISAIVGIVGGEVHSVRESKK